jgi:succinate-acetate transporter protein
LILSPLNGHVWQVNLTKAGGALGIVTAFIAYYCAVSQLLVREESYFTLPMGDIPKRD